MLLWHNAKIRMHNSHIHIDICAQLHTHTYCMLCGLNDTQRHQYVRVVIELASFECALMHVRAMGAEATVLPVLFILHVFL